MFNNVLNRNRAVDERLVEERDADGQIVAERVSDESTVDRPVAVPVVDQTRTPVAERDVVTRPVEPVTGSVAEPVTEPVVVDDRPRWAHNSFSAVLGLVVGVLAAGAVATGLLAPLGVAAGVLGVLISLTGLVRASRRGVTGHGAAFVGLIASLAAIIVGVLAIQGELSWLSSGTDEVARLRGWLNGTFPWMKHW